jgi:hypothetical protein
MSTGAELLRRASLIKRFGHRRRNDTVEIRGRGDLVGLIGLKRLLQDDARSTC